MNTNQPAKPYSPKPSPGFTIVELLIVIVVIAILAAITIVSYNGIQERATEASLKSDLSQAFTQLEVVRTYSSTGNYPTSEEQALSGDDRIRTSPNNTFQYSYNPTTRSYCLTVTSSREGVPAYHITSDSSSPKEGPCDGHDGPVAGGSGGSGGSGGTIAANTPIQDITQSQCQALPVYTGANPDAVHTVIDTRGGTTRNYEIAKLADGNCWMLNNLKLGSTTGTITLTPADTNIASNFTLPQLTTTGTPDYDNPRAYGPVPGDTGSGATNYGYLYNWTAATAGETRTTMPAGSGNAPHSICPAGWRLPSGGWEDGTGNEFSILNAKMAGFSNNQDSTYLDNYWNYYSNWKNTGPFKGVFSGYWWGGFDGQGGFGEFWSRSAHPVYSGDAFGAYFGADEVDPGGSYLRDGGVGVRCLLN